MGVRKIVFRGIGYKLAKIGRQAIGPTKERLVLDIDFLPRSVVDAAVRDPRRPQVSGVAAHHLDHVRDAISTKSICKFRNGRDSVDVRPEKFTRSDSVPGCEQCGNLVVQGTLHARRSPRGIKGIFDALKLPQTRLLG